MYQSIYAYDKNVSDSDKIQASVLRDCINMRDNTSRCNCLTYDEATCVIDYVALAWVYMNVDYTVVLVEQNK